MVVLFGGFAWGMQLLFRNDFFNDTSSSDFIASTSTFVFLVVATIATVVACLGFGAMAVAVSAEGSARAAIGAAATRLVRDVWWAVPAFWLCFAATSVVVPAPFICGSPGSRSRAPTRRR